MLKAADAFVDAGYDVHVVMIRSGGWAAAADERLRASRPWHAHVVNYERATSPARWMWSGVRQRVARRVLDSVRTAEAHVPLSARALSRVGPEVVKKARATQAQFYYAGAAGAIGLAALAARNAAPWAVDFEDAHGLEPLERGDEKTAVEITALEAAVVRNAAFVTAAGDGVAEYYRTRHGASPLIINNVFRLGLRPETAARSSLALYWVSQTIGPRRGLEVVVDALGRAGVAVTLTLRGHADEGYVRSLLARAAANAPQTELRIEPPSDPDAMIAAAAEHDIGISFEDEAIPHRAICTPNKLFIYLAAGLAVAATPTLGQTPVLNSAPEAWIPITPRDAESFAAGIRHWARNRDALHHARQSAWQAAAQRWNWHHPCERDALLARVSALLR